MTVVLYDLQFDVVSLCAQRFGDLPSQYAEFEAFEGWDAMLKLIEQWRGAFRYRSTLARPGHSESWKNADFSATHECSNQTSSYCVINAEPFSERSPFGITDNQ